MVLFTLGVDQYRVGLRVAQLLTRDRGNEAPGTSFQPGEQAHARVRSCASTASTRGDDSA